MKFKKISIAIILLFYCISISFSQPNNEIYTSPTTNSLISNDHTYSNFITKLPSGKIIHIFRLDPGITGNHIGNGGSVVKRYSEDNGETWSNPEIIYNSNYDDRLTSGGVLNNGTIICFIGRYYAYTTWSGSYLDFNYIFSIDEGETWSNLNTIPSIHGIQTNLMQIPNIHGYFTLVYNQNKAEIRYSDNGFNWDSIYYKWDYTSSLRFNCYEPTMTYVGNGKLITLFRQENSPIFQSISNNYGRTWTELDTTSIANKLFCVAPINFYDTITNRVITITNDRRGGNYDETNKSSGLWIYCSNPDSIFNSLKEYKNPHFLQRGNPNTFRFLGYPASVKLNDTTYLILYSDSYKKTNSLEDADIYQFKIYLNRNLFPNKRTQEITFDSIPQLYYDSPLHLLNASSNYLLPIYYESSDTNIVKIKNGYLEIHDVGTCTITAIQNGDYYFFPNSYSQTVFIEKASQTINHNLYKNQFQIGDTISLIASSSSSGLPITIQINDSSIAQINDLNIICKSIGKFKLDLIQNGNNHYNQAPIISEEIEIIENTNLNDIKLLFHVYPNPSHGKIMISNIQNAEIEIKNIIGNVLIKDGSLENERIFDLSNFKSGPYFIKIKTLNGEEITQKIMIIH